MAKKKIKRAQELGDYAVSSWKFSGMQEIFRKFGVKEFKKLSELQKSERVNKILLQQILAAPMPNFLLGAVIEFIDRVLQEKVLVQYSFAHFELWLNQVSGLSEEKNYEVRARIAGKYIPREEYQVYFPIGMGKKYAGSHFVTAHASPDLDTTVASFWGWVDAFACQVSDGLHIWNVPGGAAPPQVESALLFHQIFGENLLTHLAKARTSLGVSSLDLLSQKGVVKKKTEESSMSVMHERGPHAVILVDGQGYYLGDWRAMDVEGVRQVIMLLSQTLRWFENHLHVQLISLFAKEKLTKKELPRFFRSIFDLSFEKCKVVQEMTQKQQAHLEGYLIKVLGVSKGLKCSFEEFARAMQAVSLPEFQEFVSLVESLGPSSLFDRGGHLVENRPKIFNQLEKMIRALDKAIQSMSQFVEKLDIALKIKTEVFGHLPQFLSARADVEEIRSKMGSYPYLTVVAQDQAGCLSPLGVVHASDLLKHTLGTVTLRDFCNREETKIPSYLEVISVIDHHKSAIQTLFPPVALIADAQSSNALVAKLAFQINDQYSTGGMSAKAINEQIQETKKDLASSKNKRILQRLLQKQIAQQRKAPYFVDVQREIIEYLHFFYAILDDTDLLTKVSLRDVLCVAGLLNRIKSLSLKKEVEIIHFDDLKRDETFIEKAVQRILQHRATYSLYRKIYHDKEKAIDTNLECAAKGLPSTIFADTKEQNGCCRVGQTKLFAKNITLFQKHAERLRALWFEEAALLNKEKEEVDLFLHMVSTISGAEDLFSGKGKTYKHQDEIWLFVPQTEQAMGHLTTFLNAFKEVPEVKNNKMEVELLGDNAEALERVFRDSFLPVPLTRTKKRSLPIAVLRFNAGTLNSRKAQITPSLPRLTN